MAKDESEEDVLRWCRENGHDMGEFNADPARPKAVCKLCRASVIIDSKVGVWGMAATLRCNKAMTEAEKTIVDY